MARPKEFERDVALDKAVEVFWTHGYEATSMSDLQRAMGIGRQSLYDTFGDKKQIFEESLERYLERMKEFLESLLDADDGLAAVRAYMNTSVRDVMSPTPRRACMMFNTCAELASHNAEIRKQARKGVMVLQGSLELALRRAQEQGTVSPGTDAHTMAIFLTTQVGGLAVMSKSGASQKELQAAADIAIEAVTTRPDTV